VITTISQDAWTPIVYPDGGVAQVAESRYQGERLIVRRTRLVGAQAELFPNWRSHTVVTDRPGTAVWLDQDHRRHATVELCIRDLNDGVGLRQHPSGKFAANAAWLVIAPLAYNLLRWIAQIGLGARGELVVAKTLRRSRVDLLRGTVKVAEIVTEVGGRLRMGPPKTRASRRTVGLPRAVVEELAAHLAAPAQPAAFVFTAPQGGPLRVIAFRARIWRPATRNAGLDGLRIHDLRHTVVALWIAAGANPKEVAARAGHTSVSFTLNRYGHLYPGSDAALRDRLDAIYSAGQRDQSAGVVELSAAARGPSAAPGRGERRRCGIGDALTCEDRGWR
jgi:Phage integrase family/Transposase DDE domain group 1